MIISSPHGRHAKAAYGGLFQQSLLLTASNGVSAAGGFIAWSIAAHVATAHAVGIATGLFAACSFLSYLTSMALPYGLLQFGHRPGSWHIVRLASLMTSVASIVGALIFVAGAPWLDPALAPAFRGWVDDAAFCTFNIAVSLSIVIDAYMVARSTAGIAFWRNSVAAVGKIGAVVAIAIGSAPRGQGLYVAMLTPVAASVVIICVLLTFRSRRQLEQKVECSYGGEFVRYSVKTFPGALLDGAPIFILPVIVFRLVGPVSNAYFYVAWSIAGVVGLAAASIGQVALRETAASVNYGSLAKRAMGLALSVTFAAVVVLVPSARLVLSVFGSAYARSALVPLWMLLLSTVPGASFTVNVALLRARARHGVVTQVSILYAVISIAATAMFGTVGGVDGACLGWLCGVTVSAAITAAVAVRCLGSSRFRGSRRLGVGKVDGSFGAHC